MTSCSPVLVVSTTKVSRIRHQLVAGNVVERLSTTETAKKPRPRPEFSLFCS
jgi:hypothetical protein